MKNVALGLEDTILLREFFVLLLKTFVLLFLGDGNFFDRLSGLFLGFFLYKKSR